MNSISSSFLFLTIVFLVKNIECENGIHFELSVQYFSKDCDRDIHNNDDCQRLNVNWVVSNFLPQLNNATDSICSESNWKLVSENSTALREESQWNNVDWRSRPDSELEAVLRYGEFENCLSEIKGLNRPLEYLRKPAMLLSKYNFSDILGQSNITPGNSYTYQEISDAVSKFTHGKKPIIQCLWNNGLNRLALDKITLFFDESLKLIDPFKPYYPGKCPSDLPIFYWLKVLNPYSLNAWATYDDPLEKYPTLREDDNGYYIFRQKYKPARCTQDSTKCNKLNYPWSIKTFVFAFKENVNFTCNSNGNDPRHSEKFNLTSLSSIQNEIKEKWVTHFNAEIDIWEKQGKCSTYFKGIDTELKFYKKSLELFDKYNIDAILRQSNITPGKNYTYQEISDAVSKGIDGKTPIIECGKHFKKILNRRILTRIWFYLDKNLNPVDPTDIDNPFESKDSCKRDQLIYYQDTQGYIDDVVRYQKTRKPIY